MKARLYWMLMTILLAVAAAKTEPGILRIETMILTLTCLFLSFYKGRY